MGLDRISLKIRMKSVCIEKAYEDIKNAVSNSISGIGDFDMFVPRDVCCFATKPSIIRTPRLYVCLKYGLFRNASSGNIVSFEYNFTTKIVCFEMII